MCWETRVMSLYFTAIEHSLFYDRLKKKVKAQIFFHSECYRQILLQTVFQYLKLSLSWVSMFESRRLKRLKRVCVLDAWNNTVSMPKARPMKYMTHQLL